jgi:hypothetical protein
MDRRWTTIAAAAVTVLLSTIATWIAFSGNTWLAFRTSLTFSRTIVLELGNSGWEKFQSAFSAVRAVGGGIVLAYWVQGMLTAIVFAVVLWLWRAGVDWRLKSAALLTAALLGTPYVLDYDMVVLAPALALFVSHGLERGFAPWERSILALVWMVPLLARSVARITLIPLGLLAMLGLFAIIAVRGLRERTITA